MDRIDFQKSSLTWLTESGESYGRFATESCCSLLDVPTGLTNLYCLGTEVLAGNVYATGALVKRPAYLFQLAASRGKHAIFRTFLRHRPKSDSSAANAGLFKEMNLRVVRQAADTLHDFDAIERHFDAYSQFSACITLPQDGMTAVEIEFPVKHMNLQRANRCFHVETGPILFPTKIPSGWTTDNSMPEFNAAFIHFNRFDEMEITLRVPARAGLRATRFYAKTLKLQGRVSLLASTQN